MPFTQKLHTQSFFGLKNSENKTLHPEWTKTTICLDMRSKIGTSTLNGACGGTGVLRCDLSKTGARGSSRCRMDYQESETWTHIIMDCTQRVSLKMSDRM